MTMQQVSLASLADTRGIIGGPFGSKLVATDYTSSGIPVIRGSNLNHGLYVAGPFTYVSDEKFHNDLEANQAIRGDIIFTQRGTLGQVAMIPEEFSGPLIISQSQMRFRPSSGIDDAHYILAACQMPEFQAQIHENAIQTGVPHINLSILKDLVIPWPTKPLRNLISEMSRSLENKIAANRRIIGKSDELRTTLWLQAAKANATARPLSSIASFVNGRAFTKGATGTGRVVIRIADLNSGIGPSTVYNDVDASEQNLARTGDFLMAWSGSLTTARWFLNEALINQHIFKVIPKENHPLWAVATAVEAKMADFKAIASDKATTMGHIKRENLDEPVPWPVFTPELTRLGSNLWERALAAEVENESLSRTRDSLLPLLMSGKITVKDAEKAVEEVA